jgi:hypothetical protein
MSSLANHHLWWPVLVGVVKQTIEGPCVWIGYQLVQNGLVRGLVFAAVGSQQQGRLWIVSYQNIPRYDVRSLVRLLPFLLFVLSLVG